MLMLDGANLGRVAQKSLASATRLHEVQASALRPSSSSSSPPVFYSGSHPLEQRRAALLAQPCVPDGHRVAVGDGLGRADTGHRESWRRIKRPVDDGERRGEFNLNQVRRPKAGICPRSLLRPQRHHHEATPLPQFAALPTPRSHATHSLSIWPCQAPASPRPLNALVHPPPACVGTGGGGTHHSDRRVRDDNTVRTSHTHITACLLPWKNCRSRVLRFVPNAAITWISTHRTRAEACATTRFSASG